MDMQGSRQLAVTREQAWDALNDPEILKRCITGCEKFELTADNTYAIAVAIRIGPVSARFNGKVTLADIVVPESYALRFDAQGGAAGFGKGESQVLLVPNEQGVELRYTVKSTVGGKLAQIGQRLIDGVAKSLAEEFFSRWEAELVKRFAPPVAAPAPASEPPAETDAPSAAAAPATAPATTQSPAPSAGTASWIWWVYTLGLVDRVGTCSLAGRLLKMLKPVVLAVDDDPVTLGLTRHLVEGVGYVFKAPDRQRTRSESQHGPRPTWRSSIWYWEKTTASTWCGAGGSNNAFLS